MVNGLADIKRITEKSVLRFHSAHASTLICGYFREDAVYRIREALQTVHTGNQDVLKAPFSAPSRSQNFVPSHFRTATCRQRFLTFGIDPQRRKTGCLSLYSDELW